MADIREIEPLAGFAPEIGSSLWALAEVRKRTLRSADGIEQKVLDWTGPAGDENSIGSLLYHIALTEMSWLYLDILEQELPDAVRREFPFEMAGEDRRLTHVASVPLPEHVERLNRSRQHLLAILHDFSPAEWRRLRSPSDVNYSVTPEWAIFHLVEHEAGHSFQIAALAARARRFFR